MVCVKTMWTPYNLVALEELLRNNQYLRFKGIKRFEEEGENIMNRLVSIEERSLPKGIDFRKTLNYEARQKLYERRLKMTKVIPIMLREITALEDESQNQISLYITQKTGCAASLCMLIDQIDSVLQKDHERHKAMGFQTVKTPRFYLTGTQLWVEMPVDIRKASEKHEECMKSLDDVRMQRHPKHTGVGKTSQPKVSNNISQQSQHSSGYHKLWEKIMKLHRFLKREDSEAITLATKFQNP